MSYTAIVHIRFHSDYVFNPLSRSYGSQYVRLMYCGHFCSIFATVCLEIVSHIRDTSCTLFRVEMTLGMSLWQVMAGSNFSHGISLRCSGTLHNDVRCMLTLD